MLSHLFLTRSCHKPGGTENPLGRTLKKAPYQGRLAGRERGTEVTLGDRVRLCIILIEKLTLTPYHLFEMPAERYKCLFNTIACVSSRRSRPPVEVSWIGLSRRQCQYQNDCQRRLCFCPMQDPIERLKIINHILLLKNDMTFICLREAMTVSVSIIQKHQAQQRTSLPVREGGERQETFAFLRYATPARDHEAKT